MALSGTVNTTDYQGRYIQLTWTATQNKTKNQSTITWTVKGAGEATNSYYNAGPFYVNVGGTVKQSSTRINLYEGTTISAVGGSKTITHNSKGEASFTISVKAAIYQAGYNCTGSKTFTLNTIPRAATISSAKNFNDEGKPKMTFSNPSGSKATISVGVFWDSTTALIPYETVSSSATSKEWTLTTAQKNAIYNKMRTVKSKTVYYYIKTVVDGETFTNKLAKTLSIINDTPTLDPTAVVDTDPGTDGGDGAGNIEATGSNTRWIKGISDIRYAFNATAKKGATIKTYNVVCGSKKGSSASGVLANIDKADVVFTVTDSRGNTNSKKVSGTLINYVKLTCGLSASATLETSTTAKITLNISGNFFNGRLNTSIDNILVLQYRYKEDNGSYGGWTDVTPTKSNNKYSLTYEVPGTFDYQKTYTFQVRAQDDLQRAYHNYITSAEVSVNALPVFDWSKDDFNFNVPVTAPSINGYPVGTNKVLWSGGYYMTAGQTANLNGTVSSQASGIVLVFSRYDVSAGAPLNQHWSYHFVPKIMVQLHGGEGSIFDLSTSKDSYRASKYLYINDDKIVGNDNNADTGTGATGVKYTNNAFVLRYVIGV